MQLCVPDVLGGGLRNIVNQFHPPLGERALLSGSLAFVKLDFNGTAEGVLFVAGIQSLGDIPVMRDLKCYNCNSPVTSTHGVFISLTENRNTG